MYTQICRGGKEKPHSYSVFVCDNESDLALLPTTTAKSSDGLCEPCCPASKAIVLNADKTYLLNHSDEWVVSISGSSTGVGGGSVDSLDIASVTDTKQYLGI